MRTIEFDETAAIKILLSGFDPYRGLETNPSGIVALNFDAKMIANAQIQSVIFPVRYEDFDNGIIENFIDPKIDHLDAIITVSQTSVSQYIDVDRFSANIRGGGLDNNQVSKTGKILENGEHFYESSLPYKEILIGEPKRIDQRYFYNQTWATEKNDAHKNYFPGNTINKGTKWNSDQPINNLTNLNQAGLPTQGSGGDYLSNEIHYRVSKIRTAKESTKNIPQGHLHIKDVVDKKTFMEDLEQLIRIVINSINTTQLPIL